MAAIQAVRGMNDIVFPEISHWQTLEKILRELVSAYGYQEIRTPIVESTALFKRSLGEVTDIVEKEMYTFTDLNGDSLTLRPEGTASCVRAGIELGLLYNQIQRWWYMGPMFRHERPQKGRYRQFNQFGLEAFGMGSPTSDVEVILLSHQLWEKLGLSEHLVLEINSLGTPEVRLAHKQALVDYLTKRKTDLDDDSIRRLETNPLRILDSKNPQMQELIAGAPKLIDMLDDESNRHFNRVAELLNASQVPFTVNPCLVRGLDYYTHTVFEWTTTHLGAQATVCAGGRYDLLIEQLGGKPTPAVGFALGLERLVLLLETLGATASVEEKVIYLISQNDMAQSLMLQLATKCRAALPGVTVLLDCVGGNFKKQFKRADKNAAQLALILGDEEIDNGTVTLKYLRGEQAQEAVSNTEIIDKIKQYYSV